MKMKTRAEIRRRLRFKLNYYLEEIAKRDKETEVGFMREMLRHDCRERQDQIIELLWVLGWSMSEAWAADKNADVGEKVKAFEAAVIAAVREEIGE